MPTVIVEVTAKELPAVELARAGQQGLLAIYPVIDRPALTTNTSSEALWRCEVPESALAKHPEWKVVHG